MPAYACLAACFTIFVRLSPLASHAAMAEPAQKKARTTRTFLFSSESVNEGPVLSMLLGSLEAFAGIEQKLEATRTRSATKSRMLSWMPA